MVTEDTDLDWYLFLGVDPDADTKTIRKAYLRAIRHHHPDVAGPEGEATTVLVNEAWRILGDPARRASYDLSRRHARPSPEPEPQPEAEPQPEPQAERPPDPQAQPQPDGSRPRPAPSGAPDGGAMPTWPTPGQDAIPEVIVPAQSRLVATPLHAALAVGAGWLVWALVPSWLGERWSVVLLAALPLLALSALADARRVRPARAGVVRALARLLLLAVLPALVWRAGPAGTGWPGILRGVATLALGACAVLAARRFSWKVRDALSARTPGVGGYPVDSARVFEQNPPEVDDATVRVLRGLRGVRGVRLFHNVWGRDASLGVDHVAVCSDRVAFVCVIPAGCPDPSGWARGAVLAATRARYGLAGGCAARTWIVVEGDRDALGKVRGASVVDPAALGGELRAYLGEGAVKRPVLYSVWEMCV